MAVAAPGLPEACLGLAWLQLSPHFWEKSTAPLPLPLCPVLCSLKIQSILPVVPSSIPAQTGGGGSGELLETQAVQKLPSGGRPCRLTFSPTP